MENKWWKECIVYQIYPRSFMDSNGDGIGDLRGITEKLDYLKWLGIGAVWLTPVYDSPNVDMGYDIRDYKRIINDFGTMQDFDCLLSGLHSRGMRLIMDMVLNHTSDEHPWFVESRKSKDNNYRDYYIWRKGKNNAEPNNWASFFTPSAWKYDETTDEWYLHLFSDKQPDLNWENSAVREELFSIIDWWFDKGVDGFRMDVINIIAKKEGLPDVEDKGPGYVFADEHFANQPRLHEYLRDIRKNCFDGRDCMCVGETPFVDADTAVTLISPENKELDMLFHFELMDIDSGADGKWDVIPFDIMRFKRIVTAWQKKCPWNSLYWNNHDQPRVISRFFNCDNEELRVRCAKMIAASMYLLKGTPFIYQGEEIGMTNMSFSDVSQLRDIESINYYRLSLKRGTQGDAWQSILKKGRDNARTPMQWNGMANGGFSTGDPWIQVNPNHTHINVDTAMKDNNSLLHFYRKLIDLRASNISLIYGQYDEYMSKHEQVFAYTRTMSEDKWFVICNMACEYASIELPSDICKSEIALSNIENIPDTQYMRPYEARIIRC